ncbi:MAG: MFS transporter [Coriobacteriia bacterium]|nr:MFS transporter [Coriobacteriia bacterium]
MKDEESLDAGGDKLANCLTSLGHICSDINQGAISAILPFLVVAYGYDYASVAMVVFASNVVSAVIQPLFGIIGDKRPCPWFMALGVFLAGLGMTLIGFVGNYWLILASAVLSGVGVAMFHPEGGRLSNLAAGARKANGMSIFAVGGNVGFFVGPLLTAVFLSAFGMKGTLVFVFPATACALVLLTFNRRFKALGVASAARRDAPGGKEHWGRFVGVMGILGGRSIIEYGMLAFIPLFIMGVMEQSQAVSSATLSFFAICCAAATFLSGRVSERVGTHKLMIACLALTALMLCMFAFNRSFIAAVLLVGLLAVATALFYPSTVALGMSYVPRHIGTASGLSYGVVVAVGGIAEPFLGMAGDAVGLIPAMLILAAISLLSMLGGVALLAIDRRD